MEKLPIITTYTIGGCKLYPLIIEDDGTVDRSQVPTLTDCRLCKHHGGEDFSNPDFMLISCDYK